MKRQIQRILSLSNPPTGRAKEEHQKTDAHDTSNCTRFRKDLHVVVVRVVHDCAVIERFVSREDILESAKAGSCQRMVDENPPGVSYYLSAAVLVHFQLPVSLKAVQGPASP